MKFRSDTFWLKVNDYSVSKESFDLYHNIEYDLLQTVPQPPSEDLAKYYESEDYISHTDSKRSLFEKAYHLVKKYALNKKVGLISEITPNRTLLDIGAGTGEFLIHAKNHGWNATGTEPGELARARAQSKGLAIENNTESFPDHCFDVITMWHVLEHVADPKAQIAEIKRLLKKDGVAVVAVPNFKSYDANYYRQFWAAYDVPRHLFHYSEFSIRKLFSEQDIELTGVLPMPFDAFYVSLLSEKYKTGKMNVLKASWIGFKSNLLARKKHNFSSQIYILKNNSYS